MLTILHGRCAIEKPAYLSMRGMCSTDCETIFTFRVERYVCRLGCNEWISLKHNHMIDYAIGTLCSFHGLESANLVPFGQ